MMLDIWNFQLLKAYHCKYIISQEYIIAFCNDLSMLIQVYFFLLALGPIIAPGQDNLQIFLILIDPITILCLSLIIIKVNYFYCRLLIFRIVANRWDWANRTCFGRYCLLILTLKTVRNTLISHPCNSFIFGFPMP